ncbi:tRNA lysidine(34) synthetase TilS [Allobranchiibius sp. GilTou38]|uniref:tRNA lysidine(34) synthetase TilS n=1 Tax=Allobranchiibius sp. GilTou38 TaxID=2815210 RepID=UPI001AA18FF4|nr:tRNA lysidine(34) synthetase TilS [Allobranchiibius sp. GilTou38]MBO1766086.1 tRNA lysidine(34) synthetase TilS [Allobranchiibius sp. GilTou38]
MPGPHPAVAATRLAVRRAVADAPAGSLVLVACSGGADSLSLAAAAAFELPKQGLRAGAVVVDHGLQAESAQVVRSAADHCHALGLDPVEVIRVEVATADGDGPEAAARVARHAAFRAALLRHDATRLLLGHTRDDQAETVLLRLARGSGTRALAGMAADGPGPLRRPFLLSVGRAQTRAACAALDLPWWDDPHNEDPRFTRVRARRALQLLQDDLGPGLTDNLVRTAILARQDADHLDALAAVEAQGLGESPWHVEDLESLSDALRTRVWRLLMARAGATAADVAAVHVASLDELVTRWRGQGAVDIPGGLRVARRERLIEVAPRPVE